MIRHRKRTNQTVLYSCVHHLFPERCTIDVVVLDDSIGVVLYDNQTKRSWRQRVSICTLSALIQTYYYNLSELWSLLAEGVVFDGFNVSYSIDHIHVFHTQLSSDRVKSNLILQVRAYGCII